MINRRSLVKTILSWPIVAAVAKSQLFGSVPGSAQVQSEIFEKRYLAVRILRFLNTVERWHFDPTGQYAELSELQGSEALRRMLDSPETENRGIGRSLYSQLDFERQDIAPGLGLHFKLSKSKKDYLAVVHDTSARGLGAFSTDAAAIIYEGKSLNMGQFGTQWKSVEVLSGARAIGSPNEGSPQRAGSLLKSLAFGPVFFQDVQCGGFSCCSCNGCNGGWVSGCTNCGCSSCVWCCCLLNTI